MTVPHSHDTNSLGDAEWVASQDKVGLLRNLEASERFIRDAGLGRSFHPGKGKLSYREVVRENSLHVVIHGNRVSAHIDSISPLVFEEDGTAHYSLLRDVRYSLPRAVAHNLSSFAETAWRLLCGQWNHHRCELHCEIVEVDEESMDGYLDGCVQEPGAEEQHGSQEAHAPLESCHLPFNVVDEAIDLLDTQSSPWSIQLEVRVAGRLAEDRLRAALIKGLRRHRRGRARRLVGSHTRRHEEWEVTTGLDVDPLAVVDCPDDAALAAARAQLQSSSVPLETSPPVRARLARTPDGDVLMLNLHHVATDGVGGLRLLRSVACAYRGAPDPLPHHDPLADRTLPVRLAEALGSTRLRRCLALADRLRDVVTPPARLAGTRSEEESAADGGCGFYHVALGEEQTRRLTDSERSGSVNDVLLAALHLAVADWNAHQGAPCRRVTVLMPSNLRPPRWREEWMGNFSLPARIATIPRQRTSPTAALDAVVAQTSRKRRTGMGTALLQLLDGSQRLPLRAKRAGIAAFDRTGRRLADTVLLSDLGNVIDPPAFGEEAGNASELWFSAPSRMPLSVSLGALTVSGHLHLVFRYHRRVFDDRAAQRFAEGYLDRLRAVISAT